MAKIRAISGNGGGGGETATTLWTNPSPSSAFAEQTVNLTLNGQAESMRNYDVLRIYFKYTYTSSDIIHVDIPVDDFISVGDSNTLSVSKYMMGARTQSYYYVRIVLYASDTSILVSTCARRNSSGQDNSYVIPTQIEGIKFS